MPNFYRTQYHGEEFLVPSSDSKVQVFTYRGKMQKDSDELALAAKVCAAAQAAVAQATKDTP